MVAEQLEQRLFLAGDVMAQRGIDGLTETMSKGSVVPTSTETAFLRLAEQEVVAVSEFVAVNRDGLRDYFAQSSDWIELENLSDQPINLHGWFLTDDADDLSKWRIPQDTVLQGGERYLVRASGRDIVTPDGELHANFRLSSAGEYLAVVRPGGSVSWETPIVVPQQFADTSYGISDLHLTTAWVERGSPAKVIVPQDDSLQNSWHLESFDDTAWADQTLGVGFADDNPTQEVSGFRVRMLQSIGGADGMVNNIREADSMLSGGSALARHEIGLDISTNTPVIDYGSGVGTFPTANLLPNGATDASVDEFVLRITASVTIPPGSWMIGFGSADGSRLRMPDVEFTQAYGQRGFSQPSEGELLYQNRREHDWTWGVFENGGPRLSTNLELIYFGHEGVESLELAIAPGQSDALPNADSWRLLEDGTLGWQVQSTVPAPPAEAKAFVLSDIEAELQGRNTTAYVRAVFEASDVELVERLQLKVRYDDGFVAYMNGTEIARVNFSGQPGWNSAANGEKSDTNISDVAVFDLTEHLELIREGTNILAVYVLNASLDSPLLLFAPELEAVDVVPGTLNYLSTPTPGESNIAGSVGLMQAPEFAVSPGMFSSEFRLQLSAETPDATIRYTTDGSLPDETSLVYTEPILISESTTVRAFTTLRNHIRSTTRTAHYIKFVDGAAEFSSDLPLLVIDTFGGAIRAGEFAASFSLLLEPGPDGRTRLTGAPTVATRSGIRVRGTSSSGFAKSPFALEFWRDASNTDRDLPLLGMPPDSDWILHGPFLNDRTHTKNAFVFDLSNQLGYYAPRTRYVELFVNRDDGVLGFSDYAGIYLIVEKIKRAAHRVDVPQLAPLASKEDITGGYIIKRDRPDPDDTGFAIGDIDQLAYVEPKEEEIKQRPAQEAWLHDYLNRFDAVLDASNLTHPKFGHYTDYLDPVEWVDYAILNEIAWNVDAYILSSYMYIDGDGVLHAGPVWDYDRSLESHDGRDDIPLSWRSYGTVFEEGSYLNRYFGWWGKLFQHVEFQQSYIDRWQQLRGAEFGTENLLATINRLADEVREAEPRDTERWPTVRPRTESGFGSGLLDGTWQGELAHQAEWLGQRLAWLDSKFLGPPVFDRRPGRLSQPTMITLAGPETATLYYTIDGTDPRLPGGGIAATAMAYGGSLAIDQTTTITVRSYDPNFDTDFVLDNEAWSGPTVGLFEFSSLLTEGLRVSEVHYNPGPPSPEEIAAGFDDKDDFEFIELVNIGASEIDLAGVRLIQTTLNGETEGVAFVFSDGNITRLSAGSRLVVGEDMAAFQQRYGTTSYFAGEWTGGLSNARETITLAYGDEIIQQFRYDDRWHPTTDGGGFSLESVDVTAETISWGHAEAWHTSQAPGGTPGRSTVRGDFNSDGRVDAQDIDLLYQVVRTQGHPTSFDLTDDGRVLQDDVDELITGILMTRFGDTDLDGDVDSLDFATLATNFGNSEASWTQGEFDGDGKLAFSDFVILANNFDSAWMRP